MIELLKDLPEDANSEQINDRIAALMKEKRAVQRVIEGPAWEVILTILGANAQTLRNSLTADFFHSTEELYKDQYTKGRAMGFVQAPQIIEAIIMSYEIEITKLSDALKEKANERSERDDDDNDSTNGHAEPDLFTGGPEFFAP